MDVLKDKTEEYLPYQKKYILFGAGHYGRIAIDIVGRENIMFFIDNSEKKDGTEILGIPVWKYEKKVEEIRNSTVIICMSEDKCKSVKKQLEKNEKIEVFTIHEYKNKQIISRINNSLNNIDKYMKAIGWIYSNTIDKKGIINFTGAKEKRPYPEVTGYFIPSLIRWGHRELAKQYAIWLCDIQNADGSWSDVYGGKSYIFDTAQIIKGLLAARELLNDIDGVIIRGCDWIISKMQADGRLFQEDTSAWDMDENPDIELVHIYCLSPLIEAGKKFKREKYISVAKKILDYYKENFIKRILSFEMLSHYYAYVIEGLIDLGEIELACEAMSKIETYQREDGSIAGLSNVNWICSTGLFQFAIIWFRLGNIENGKKAFDYACRLQNKSGGWFGSYEYEKGDKPTYLPKQEISWAVKFFLDALYFKSVAEFENIYDTFLDEISENDQRYNIVLKAIESIDAKKVLEVGCGKGRYLKKLLKDNDRDYYAVDISSKVMKDLPRSIIRKQGTITCIPFPDKEFDFTYACEALEHAIDIKSAIKEMVRVTKKGGSICIIDKNSDMLGAVTIEEWEQWFNIMELRALMERYCRKVTVYENLVCEGKNNNIFYGWIGEL